MSNGSFILAARPIEVAGRPPVQIVGYFEAEFKTPGARGFFYWLVTPEAQGSLTDTFAAVDGTLTRAFGPKCDPTSVLKIRLRPCTCRSCQIAHVSISIWV